MMGGCLVHLFKTGDVRCQMPATSSPPSPGIIPPLFNHHANAQEVVRWLRASDAENRTESLAWVVLPDRLHWLFRLHKHRLSSVVRSLKSRSAHALHQRNATEGRIWQPGCHDQSQCDERQLLACATDILSTPMRAGLARGLHSYPFSWCRWPV